MYPNVDLTQFRHTIERVALASSIIRPYSANLHSLPLPPKTSVGPAQGQPHHEPKSSQSTIAFQVSVNCRPAKSLPACARMKGKRIWLTIKARDLSYGTNVVVVSNQSANSKNFLLFAVWLLTTTTFDPYIKSRALLLNVIFPKSRKWVQQIVIQTKCITPDHGVDDTCPSNYPDIIMAHCDSTRRGLSSLRYKTYKTPKQADGPCFQK